MSGGPEKRIFSSNREVGLEGTRPRDDLMDLPFAEPPKCIPSATSQQRSAYECARLALGTIILLQKGPAGRQSCATRNRFIEQRWRLHVCRVAAHPKPRQRYPCRARSAARR